MASKLVAPLGYATQGHRWNTDTADRLGHPGSEMKLDQ
jgi:hypothetical protein